MNRYIIGCDLDETLLTSNKKIKLYSKIMIKNYIKKGHYFILATGRPLSGAYKYWKQLSLKMPIITDNGGSIYFYENNKINEIHFSIKQEIFQEFLNKVDKYILSAVSSTQQEILVQNIKETPSWIIHNDDNSIKLIEGKMKDILCHNPILPNLWIYKEHIDEFLKVIKEYDKYFTYRNWGLNNDRYGIEIFSINSSKGNALNYLKNLYKIPNKNTISFGDQYNDLSMINAANYGICMINAQDSIKIQSKYITDYDNNHNGVVKYLNKLIKS